MPIELIARGCNINRCRRRMLRATVAWLVQIGSVAALYAPGLANAAALEARTPAELAAMFQADAPGWVIQDHGYGGAASGKWTCALGGDAAWSNYRVDCQIHLAKSADRRDGLELGSFVAFSSHANLGGYEAGLILRRQSPQKFYRVAVSSLWKEIILWRPSGGVVQAVAFPFEIGKTYRLVAECRGPRIAVQVDGKPVIDWWDAADPIASGKVGLARKEGESHFAAVKVEPLDAPAEKAPAHTPRFHERSWHNLRFFFDGDEPLFTLKDDNVLDLMKFRPGYRPILYTLNFITDYVLFSPRQIKQCRLVQDGAQLIIETVAVDPRPRRWPRPRRSAPGAPGRPNHSPNRRPGRGFVRIVDTCEAFELPGASLLVEPLGISGFADLDGRINEDLDKVAGRQALADPAKSGVFPQVPSGS
jgi:hypothetical protein